MNDRNKVIDRFLGDSRTPIDWNDEEDQRLHYWFDDLHCPQPISPMWFDVGGWWLTCGYMYRRFGVPFGKDWVAKKVNGYVMTAVVPRDEKEEQELTPYYEMVMPVYAANFLDWWKRRYLPEICANFEFLDNFPMDQATLPELMVLLEDALDIQERHFRLHWILNLAQFQSSLTFGKAFAEIIGENHTELIGRILISDEDRNWDSVRDLWRLKEKIKRAPLLAKAFQGANAAGIISELQQSDKGLALLRDIDSYKMEYGYKSMFTHEYTSVTWRENPGPIFEALRGYLVSDYDYEKEIRELRRKRDAAIAEMWSHFPPERSHLDRQRLETALQSALRMAPLTPDHHFYMDQGTYARVRLVFMAIGRNLVQKGVFTVPEDIFFLRYHELRLLSANHAAFEAKALVKSRRKERDKAVYLQPPQWAGTITDWSMFREPYKGNWGWPDIYRRIKDAARQNNGTIQGLGASPGIVEGVARIVDSPEQFDQIQIGEILVCKMTNPAWVVVFTKIGGLVTDAGGALSHPAVVSREFGIPAVVGTAVATQKIKTGQRVRVNGAIGLIELLDTGPSNVT